VFGVRVTETPVVVYVPEARVEAVDSREGDEDGLCRGLLVHAVNAQASVEHDGG
jgi:hypothetical protein